MYFRLNPECFFIRGDRHGAIYDLIEGDIYSLNSRESELIRQCENNGVVDPTDNFLIGLRQRCIGNFYDKPVYIEKIRLGSPIQEFQPGSPPFIRRAFLEINNTCDQSCWYCGYNGIHRSTGCYGCNKWNESGRETDIETWKSIIDELSDLDCRSLFFTGGDLTSVWDKTRELIAYAENRFQTIFVSLNSNKANPGILEDIGEKAIPVIQTESIPDAETGNIYVLLVDAEKNRALPKKTKDNIIFDYVSKDFRAPETRNLLHPVKKISRIDIFRFSHNKKFHPCLGNSIAIAWNGNILPCPMLRSCSVGNIRDTPVYSVFAERDNELEKYWSLRLDSLSKCGKCEFRFTCSECRAVEFSLTEEITSNELCNYDPAEGTWV